MHPSFDPTPAASELREGSPGRSLGLLASAGVAAAWARSQWASLFAIYRREDREAAEVRAAHLAVLLRLTPWLMAANVLNVGLVIWVFRDAQPAGLWAWGALLLGVAATGLLGWQRARRRPRLRVSVAAVQRATRHAALLAALWGTLPVVWLADADPRQQMLVACLVCGMIGAGSFALATLPAASLAYATVLTSAAIVALWRAGPPLNLEVAALLLWYAVVVVLGALHWARKSTALLLSEREAARQQRLVALLLHDFEANVSEALWETGADGCLVHVSPRLAELFGTPADALPGQPLLALVRRRDEAAALRLAAALDQGRPFVDLRLPLPDEGAGPRWWAVRGKPLLDDAGLPRGWRGVLDDVTEQVLAQQRLHTLAHHDSLTGLANRLSLHQALAEALREGRSGALLSLDLDHFKAINDSFGHTAGDAVLVAVAQRLRGCVRPGDLVARLAGDEFAVLALSAASDADAEALAARLVERLGQPVEQDGRALRSGASVGVVTWTGGRATVDQLMVQVDLALYEAKAGGRGRHVLYRTALGERSLRRSRLEHELRAAIEAGQLHLCWQPKVDLREWRVVGAEVLVRWTHPALGTVSPVEFVPIAEQCGLIDALGDWVLQQACECARRLPEPLSIAVNVSPVQLRSGDYAVRVLAALRRSGLAPQRLELEITESVFLEDAGGALSQLALLRERGVRIALDDFGTGYSSLAYLRRFPFDTLKIDRSFINEVLLRDDAKALVRMMTQLATTLGMRTVAEGVETAVQLGEVARAGCDDVQGYLVARPLPLDELLALLRGWQAVPPVVQQLH